MGLSPSLSIVLAVAALALGAAPSGCSPSAPTDTGRSHHGGSGAGGASSSASSSDVSTSAGTGGGSAQASSSSGGPTSTTAASTGSGPSCDDSGPNEPNDSEVEAHWLGAIDDCDETGGMVAGIIANDGDVDWYEYSASDTALCATDPTRDLTANVALRVCKYAECFSSSTVVTCPVGTTVDVSPEGRDGCCGLQGFTISVDCGFDDSASIFIRVDSEGGADCEVYSLAYHD